eukprot:CAMPEP_0173413180 /NCGR_PEP_ID=MMETSP1356-20130122/81385_1 /TAXON_ID=77927 ORGANISM="Hemiselmis virescens, Strain PCC157" /NCGR_SAMPLE_ID=MMETSP1356 /ASSEMBLY_ACC=CAM_ASM_000847 /LENGTH=197 /DNA_ID=CAMNT_0014375185 /DNA_START=18 /DNA_END=611 /DNA_ORIENTATION=+
MDDSVEEDKREPTSLMTPQTVNKSTSAVNNQPSTSAVKPVDHAAEASCSSSVGVAKQAVTLAPPSSTGVVATQAALLRKTSFVDPFQAQKMNEMSETEKQYISALATLEEKKRFESEAIERHAGAKRRLLEVQQEYLEAQSAMKKARVDRVVAEAMAQAQAQELEEGMEGLGQLVSSFEKEKSRMGQLAASRAHHSH